jgi:hypothetical protein
MSESSDIVQVKLLIEDYESTQSTEILSDSDNASDIAETDDVATSAADATAISHDDSNYDDNHRGLWGSVVTPSDASDKYSSSAQTAECAETYEKLVNRCIECGVDMGDDNPRQYCGKTQCCKL